MIFSFLILVAKLLQMKQKNGVEPSAFEVYEESHQAKEKPLNDEVANVIVCLKCSYFFYTF